MIIESFYEEKNNVLTIENFEYLGSLNEFLNMLNKENIRVEFKSGRTYQYCLLAVPSALVENVD